MLKNTENLVAFSLWGEGDVSILFGLWDELREATREADTLRNA